MVCVCVKGKYQTLGILLLLILKGKAPSSLSSSSSPSVNEEDVRLFQAEACLVLIEERGERLDVHGVVHFHHV